MAEQHYAFIKKDRVENIAVFADKDEELAKRILEEQGYDKAIWVGENAPHLYSEFNGKSFTPPTIEYLIERGIVKANDIVE